MDKLAGAVIRDSTGKLYDLQIGPSYDGQTVPTSFGYKDYGIDINNWVQSSFNSEYYYTTTSNFLLRRNGLIDRDDSYVIGPVSPSNTNINKIILDNKANVYVCDDLGQVSKYDQNLESPVEGGTTEQKPIWQVLTGGTANDVCISKDNLNIFVAKSNGIVYKLLASDGSLVWQADIGEAVTTVGVDSNGMIYAGTANGKFIQINADGSLGISTTISGAITKIIVSSGDAVYVAGTAGVVYRLDSTTETITWKWNFTTNSKITAMACNPTDGRLYVGCLDGNIYRLKPDTGEKLWWGLPDQTPRSIVSMSINNYGNLYVSTASGAMYAMSEIIIGG